MSGFRNATLQDALTLAMSLKLVSTRTDYDEHRQIALFDDGTEIAWQSEYEYDFSEVTPGNGIEPPSIYIKRPKEVGK